MTLRGLAVKKIALCLWLALAMPSMALGLERRDGAYYCTEKFSGGVQYNKTLQQWEGTSFVPGKGFVVKLSFRETVKNTLGTDEDAYDVTITEEGTSPTRFNGCVVLARLPSEPQPPLIDEFSDLSCTDEAGLTVYKFNFRTRRFLKIYTAGYLFGDNNDDTPAISGGLCTKISQ